MVTREPYDFKPDRDGIDRNHVFKVLVEREARGMSCRENTYLRDFARKELSKQFTVQNSVNKR